MKSQKILAVSGVKNSGKTTLLERLLPALRERGLTCAVVKHDGHRFEPDRPGTDSFRMLAAGALGAAVFDGEKFQVVKHAATDETALAALFPEAELVLLEGCKASAWPKIEVVRAAVSSEPVCAPETLLALVTDGPARVPGVPVFSPEEIEPLADLVAAWVRKNG